MPDKTLAEIPRTQPELNHWLKQAQIDEIECVVGDMSGVPRGKVMPINKFTAGVTINVPLPLFFLTITGATVDFAGDEAQTEHDLVLSPDLSTICHVPWASTPTVLAIHDALDRNGVPCDLAPRNVLRKVLDAYHARGWRPVVAPEMEFYLTKPNLDPDQPLQPPIGRSGRPATARQNLSISAVDEYDKIIDDIYDFAEAQGIGIDTIIHEDGPGQIEINLNHGDPLALADQAFLFKRIVREAALRHECHATFMAKPMSNLPGSAMHIHQSVLDVTTGKNIFSTDQNELSSAFYAYMGGQQKYLAAGLSFMAPYVNSYRRLVPDMSAPINLEWGHDNRSSGLRVPLADPANRRVENRIIGADANPYLAIAVSLACGYLGMVENAMPREPLSGNAYDRPRGLARSLDEALDALEAAEPLQDALGRRFCALYKTIKRYELDEYRQVISPWEREFLLLTV